jgi:hypothetical protein
MIFAMKYLLLAILLTISNLLIAQHETDSIIYWDINRKLQWSDFLDSVPDAGTASNMIAITPVEIITKGYWDKNMPNFTVMVYFMKYEAWTKDNSSSIVLNHEQLHFDIAELYARKIRKRIHELREMKEKDIDVYGESIKTLLTQRNDRNKLYDAETLHGVFEDRQKEWNLQIAKELCELKQYKINNTNKSSE